MEPFLLPQLLQYKKIKYFVHPAQLLHFPCLK